MDYERKITITALGLIVIYCILSVLVKLFGEQGFPGNIVIFRMINNNQIYLLNGLMIFLSKYGREYIWIPVTAVLFALGGKYRKSSLILVGAFLLAIVTGEISKFVMAQPRPFLVLQGVHVIVPKPLDYSYPSGHALIVGTGAIVVMLTLPYYISFPLTAEAILVSYSRVYVGVHWPVDVFAGWILGAGLALASLRLYPFILRIYKGVLRIFGLSDNSVLT
ncbi:phosphatase PAP2 family protein [Sulfolobales archaeon HS-7]|nr:phosphatase PAP2 family protein [Sulfolobales archaeon HS-7]